MPKIEATVRIHKTSRWEPENLYISLPFTAGDGSEFYIDKTGCVIRPGIDQLPGTCQDFYLIPNGVAWTSKRENGQHHHEGCSSHQSWRIGSKKNQPLQWKRYQAEPVRSLLLAHEQLLGNKL